PCRDASSRRGPSRTEIAFGYSLSCETPPPVLDDPKTHDGKKELRDPDLGASNRERQAPSLRAVVGRQPPRAAAVKTGSHPCRSFSRARLWRALELGVPLVACGLLALAAPAVRAKEAATSGRLYAVATENETVSRTALRVLERGGNAVDAA